MPDSPQIRAWAIRAIWHCACLALSIATVVLFAWPGFDVIVVAVLGCWALWIFTWLWMLTAAVRAFRAKHLPRPGFFELGVPLTLAGLTLFLVLTEVPYRFALRSSAGEFARLADAAARGERFTRQNEWVDWLFAERIDVGDGVAVLWLPREIPKHRIALGFSPLGFAAQKRFSDLGDLDVCVARPVYGLWSELHTHGQFVHTGDSQPAAPE